MCTSVEGIKLLYIVAACTHHVKVVEPYQVWSPLPSLHMGQERRVCSHLHDVSVSLDTCHVSRLHEGCVEVVPLLVVAAVACILACEYLWSLAWVAVISVCVLLEEKLSSIVVLVDKLHVHCTHRCPEVIEPLAASVWA